MMLEGESPKKKLWKNIQTQKIKYSVADVTHNSPIVSIQEEGNRPSQNFRQYMSEKVSGTGNQDDRFENNFELVAKQADLNEESVPHFMVSGHHFIEKIGGNELSQDFNNKSRTISIGDESVVQEVVDFKYQNVLEIADEEDQQPMIMSLGSQSNPAIKSLKLSRTKEEVEKLQNMRLQLLNFVKQEQLKYKQFFESKFLEFIAYVISFYSKKIEVKGEQGQRINNYSIFKSYGSDETPHFNKKQLSSYKLQTQSQQNDILEQQIYDLQRQISQQKETNNQLLSSIKNLKKENQEMNEMIFDYQQKIAQFELQVSLKVEELVQEKMKDITKFRNSEHSENQRIQYMDQIQDLEKQIQRLERLQHKCQSKQFLTIQEELIEREEYLIQREKQILEKERVLNEMEMHINSDRLELELKYKNLQSKENEIHFFQSKLQQKQMQLVLKQKQLANKQRIDVVKSSRQQQNNTQQEYYPEYDSDFNFKIKQLASRPAPITKPRLQQKQWNASKMAQTYTKGWNHMPIIEKPEIEIRSKYSVAKTKSREKQRERYNLDLHRMGNRSQPGNGGFMYSSSYCRNQDKTKLDDLGAKLESLRNQIRKEIKDSE